MSVRGGNREQGTGNREQGTGDREQGTGDSFNCLDILNFPNPTKKNAPLRKQTFQKITPSTTSIRGFTKLNIRLLLRILP
ncbi:MAG: hypothetical protein ACLBM2_04540, partial [Dolichospermum sp.]